MQFREFIMKYAVTGGLGFIGSNICRELLKKGHQVVIIDNCNTGNETKISDILNQVELYKNDIREKNKIKKILEDVNGIFHNAALTDVQESYQKKEEYFSVNIEGTKNIFEIAKNYNIKVIFASSASVYGNTKIIPIKENFDKNPINPYGQTKMENELSSTILAKNGLRSIGLRYFNVYGIGQTNTYAGVITQFLRKLKENKPPIIFGKGSQIRDFIHVNDVAEANIAAMNSNIENDFFNIGSGIGTSIIELAKMMIQISKLQMEPSLEAPVTGDIENSTASIEYAKNRLEWNPKIPLEIGLKEIMNKYEL